MDKSEKIISDTYLQAVLDIWSQKREQTTFLISGNCMSPMIKDGDYLTVEHGNRDIHMGDVVAFGSPRNPSVLRVVKIENNGGKKFLLLKPDRYYTTHSFISGEKILGKVIEIRGSDGYLHLNSIFWKCCNYILSIRSYMSWRCSTADSTLWKGINLLITIRSKIFLRRFSIDIILWKGVHRAHRIWFLIQRFVFTNGRRYG